MSEGRHRHIVAIGGGHGQAMTLRAVVPHAALVTAVVSTADDGGSTGRLRATWPVPALGDLRRCIAALADPDRPWSRALAHRFTEGELAGHPAGNLALLALLEELGDLQAACDELARTAGVEGARHRVVPITDHPIVLHGRTTTGDEVAGQVSVGATSGLDEVWVEPAAVVASPVALEAIAGADLIVLGPGSLYTSVLAATVVGDLRKALADTTAPVAYVANLRASDAEVAGYDLPAHVAALGRHGIQPDVVVASHGTLQGAVPGVDVVVGDLAAVGGSAHDPERLGSLLAALVR